MTTKPDWTKPATKRSVASSPSEILATAAANPSDAMNAVMEIDKQTSAEKPLNETDKQTLQAMAHGGEVFGNSYGSGPTDGDAEARNDQPRTELIPEVGDDRGDSASPAASALATRKKPRAKRQGF